MPIKIFFCYSRRDEALLNKLKAHLRPLQRQGLIDLWHDRDISAGDDWEQAIIQQLNEADIILLLVSPDFMESDYCYGKEMQRALERHANGECVVIPIILRPVYWHGEPLGKLQALPTDGKPIAGTEWHDQDSAFYDVVIGMNKVIQVQQAKIIQQALESLQRALLANAQKNMNERERLDFYSCIAAKIKTKKISIEFLYKACLFYCEMFPAYNKYLDYILSTNPTEEAKMSLIRGKQELQEKMLAKNITTETLKSLINDWFIVEKMRDEKIQKEFYETYRAQNHLEIEFIYFQNVAAPTYEIFINTHSISEQEIKIFISIPLRYSFYKAYFANQQSILNLRKTTLDDWLEKQRKEVSFLHNTLEQTAQRISESPYWKI